MWRAKSRPESGSTRLGRRIFLKGTGAAVALAALSPGRVLAGPREERIVWLFNTHTHESLTVTYFGDGAYCPSRSPA